MIVGYPAPYDVNKRLINLNLSEGGRPACPSARSQEPINET